VQAVLNLTFGQILGWAAGIFVILSAFVEITPIKINPISSFLAWIGKKTSQNVLDKVDELNKDIKVLAKKVDEIEAADDEREAITRRVRILRFGDELRAGQPRHSQEGYDQVLDDIDFYERYCHDHPMFKNNKTKVTTKMIIDAYQKAIDDNDFL